MLMKVGKIFATNNPARNCLHYAKCFRSNLGMPKIKNFDQANLTNIKKRKNEFSAKNQFCETIWIQVCWLNCTFKVICHYLFDHKMQWIKYMDTDRKTKGFLSNCVQPSKGKRRKSRISFIGRRKVVQKLC